MILSDTSGRARSFPARPKISNVQQLVSSPWISWFDVNEGTDSFVYYSLTALACEPISYSGLLFAEHYCSRHDNKASLHARSLHEMLLNVSSVMVFNRRRGNEPDGPFDDTEENSWRLTASASASALISIGNPLSNVLVKNTDNGSE